MQNQREQKLDFSFKQTLVTLETNYGPTDFTSLFISLIRKRFEKKSDILQYNNQVVFILPI